MALEPALPAFVVLLLWVLFAGTHIGLAAPSVRTRLDARLGRRGGSAVFDVVALVSFSLLVVGGVRLRAAGAPGPGAWLAGVPGVHALAIATIVAGTALAAAGIWGYPKSPTALYSQRVGEPGGIERVTRHGFFAGLCLFAIAHVPLAQRLSTAVFFAGLALFTAVGAAHQDAKLAARRGRAYARYVDSTSAIPFAAILSGRQRLVLSELPWGALGGGVALAFALRGAHDAILARDGAYVIGATLAGAGIATFQAARRARRDGVRSGSVSPSVPSRAGGP